MRWKRLGIGFLSIAFVGNFFISIGLAVANLWEGNVLNSLRLLALVLLVTAAGLTATRRKATRETPSGAETVADGGNVPSENDDRSIRQLFYQDYVLTDRYRKIEYGSYGVGATFLAIVIGLQ